ncbi:MAG TPA: inositol monophosphatase family protein [Acidimicrobiales bacterium]|nr:inositol monophosphatase family protein [Acidimicrobiales bacterium]
MVDTEDLCHLAEEAARAAGALLLDGLDGVRTDVSTKSSATDMVSEMDRAAEALIVEVLLGARPDDGMVGEEGTDRAGRSGVRWIVDPLDGTTNYLYGLAGFGVSIAAEHDGEVVAGVVLDVVRDELFAAQLDGGATRDGRPIAASVATDLTTALVATGFSYDGARRERQAAVLHQVLPRVRDIRRFGAAAVDLCSVACGRVDAYYERGLAPWDLAAGGLIAREAGAIVTDFAGGPAAAGAVVAAAPGIAAELRDLLIAAGAADA